MPDPTRHNADLQVYRDAIEAEARKRGAAFVDLFNLLPDGAKATPRQPLTENSLHFTPYGAWRMAQVVEAALLPGKQTNQAIGLENGLAVSFDFATRVLESESTATGLRLKLLDPTLPDPPLVAPGYVPNPFGRTTRIAGLKPGRYVLKVDGKAVMTANADAWKAGQFLVDGQEGNQVEALRQAINAKNELYFYRWRPQNETYLFGFRKHEQGQNAREIPQFDPLVTAREAEIARLRVPLPTCLRADSRRRGQAVTTTPSQSTASRPSRRFLPGSQRGTPPPSNGPVVGSWRPWFRKGLILAASLGLGALMPIQKSVPIVDPDAEAERASFQVADGFEVNLFASDPLLAKPIQMNFDARGRLWVASSEVYPRSSPARSPTTRS